LHGFFQRYNRIHLKQAVLLMPERVAARALLALAHAEAGDGEEFWRVLAEVEAMTPVTMEDKLFKGQAVAIMRPVKATP
jgi:hypothetical protein